MESICLLYFSGTGMTKYIVRQMKTSFEEAGCKVSLEDISKTAVNNLNLNEVDAIGVLYPVHASNPPQIVERFIKKLPAGHRKVAFIIYTAAENSKVNYSASRAIIKSMTSKGYDVIYNKLIAMPSNFAVRHEDARAREIVRAGRVEAEKSVAEMLRGVVHFDNATPASIITASLGKSEWIGAPLVGKSFYANKTCTLCQRCIEVCPKNNIRCKGDSIAFQSKCMLCMRCIYTCPSRAIKLRKPFNAIVLKKWYDKNLLE